ncbi:hypothetical protein H5410_051475 [Solanum commersonii]|uniref:Uncharacterized protein n=1 Tax=Solanum commersonii TaxID=4109 RepID=A0A9J5X133_SOLCO|nr:hypothetical protein H5410_051475 [Solanum commersonii]
MQREPCLREEVGSWNVADDGSMLHGDLKFKHEVLALYYHVTIGVIVDGASLIHEHQCVMRVSLDDDVL